MAEATRENDREEPGPGWALREARLHFTFESQNMGLMKDIGKFAFLLSVKYLILTESYLKLGW